MVVDCTGDWMLSMRATYCRVEEADQFLGPKRQGEWKLFSSECHF